MRQKWCIYGPCYHGDMSPAAVRAIADLDAPELAPYRTLRRPEDHRRAGVVVAEGGTVVERLLRSPLGVVSALLTRPWLDRLGPLLEARAEPVSVFVAPGALLESVTGFRYHEGVLAVGRLPAERPLGEVVAAAGAPRLAVALDGVTWPDNLGGIVRAAAALGAAAVIAGETAASPFLRRAVRIGMGAAFAVPIAHPPDLAAALHNLKAEHGFRIIAAVARGGTPLPDYAFPADACVVVGHEFEGLRPAVRAACDDAVTIPMAGAGAALDSLNVAAAAAVVLYEFRRQRPCPAPRP